MAVAGKPKTKTDADVSLNAAAKAAGENRQTLLQRAVAGEIEARRVAGRTVVSRKSLNRLLVRLGRDPI